MHGLSGNIKRNAGRPDIIRMMGGRPTLMAGDTPLPAPVFCLYYDQALKPEVIETLAANGIGTFAVRHNVGVGAGSQAEETIERLAERMALVARLAPRARLIADGLFFPSDEWLIDNPDECFFTAQGQIMVLGRESLVEGPFRRRDYIRVPGPALADARGKRIGGEDPRLLYGRRRVSPFSEAFANAAAVTVRKLLRALDRRGVGHQLWGVFVECYVCGEWNLGMYSPDHGRAAIRGFRDYLRQKYRNDARLRAAWDDATITLGQAVPAREHAQSILSPWRMTNQRQYDYREAEAQALVNQFLAMARAVKAANPRLAVGGFFPGGAPYQSDCLRLYSDPAINFIGTPLAYQNRFPGGGMNSQSPFCDALASLGKVWFDEMDELNDVAGATMKPYSLRMPDRRYAELLWRDAGQMLVRGHNGWWLDFGYPADMRERFTIAPPYSCHLNKEVLRFHREFAAVWRQLPRLDRRSRNEIKVFLPSTMGRHHEFISTTDMQRHVEWTLLGAPVEFDILENLLAGRARPGKLNVIYGAAGLDRETVRALGQKLRRQPAWVIWMEGPGILPAGRLFDEYRLDNLGGLRQTFALLAQPLVPEGATTPEAARCLGLRPGTRIGQYGRKVVSYSGFADEISRIARKWKLAVTDPEAVPLARLAKDGAVVVAMKKDRAGTTHLAYNLPILNTVFFRAVARQAGCHLFTHQDDVVYASRGLVMLHAAYTGIHRLYLPGKGRPFDLRANKTVAPRGNQLILRLARGDTRLFRLCQSKA